MDSLFYREYIKINFNVGLFMGLLLNYIVSVTVLLLLLYSSLKKFLQKKKFFFPSDLAFVKKDKALHLAKFLLKT